jgi:large subunit ribosomal protein L24
MNRIRKGDTVVVIAGKDKGKQGAVTQVLENRVMVENVNMIKKHVKPNPQAGVQGGIVEREASIHASNVLLLNPVTKKGDRVGFKTLAGGKKVRVFRSNGEAVDA